MPPDIQHHEPIGFPGQYTERFEMNDEIPEPNKSIIYLIRVLALLGSIACFITLTFLAFTVAMAIGIALWPEENPFFAIGAYLLYGLVGVLGLIYPNYLVTRGVFQKIIKFGVNKYD